MQQSGLVSVIVLNWNNFQDTIECINSLEYQDYPNREFIVVDNGSTNQSVIEINRVLKGKMNLIVNNTNLGFSGGNNIGIRYALKQGAEYILLLNNDTVVDDPQLISKLVSVYFNDKDIGLACPTISHFSNPEVTWYAGAKYNLWRGGGVHIQEIPRIMEYIDTGYATGCCVMASRKLLDRVGFLDDKFFLYEEDVDWSLRAKKAGFRVVYVPNAFVLHKVSKSSADITGMGTYSPTAVYYKFRNRILLIKKHGNAIQKLLIWPILIFFQIVYHTFAYVILLRWQKLFAMIRGTVSGIRLNP